MIYDKLVPVFGMINGMIEDGKAEMLPEMLESAIPQLKQDLIREDILNCTGCNLCTTCPHIPFEGRINAEVMFVGEAPSDYDFQSMKPFSGPTGAIFQNMIRVAKDQLSEDFDLKNIWITNINKCRPIDEDGNPTKPLINQIASCKVHLDREIELVNPKIIICLGSTACETLIHPKFKLNEEHGRIFGNNTKIMGTYSPGYVSYLGENTPQGIDIKLKMWEDLKVAAEYLKSLNPPEEWNDPQDENNE